MIPKDLVEAIKNRKAILFAGAGLSMNLKLPSYGSLIDKLADELGFDRELFQIQGDYMALAEYYALNSGNLGKLRSWMDNTWHDSRIDISASVIHKLIAELNFSTIYTTNFDRWIEKAFDFWKKDCSRIVTVADIAKAKEDRTQIVKFHGDFEDDNSLVFTESSYFARMDFESPLDIKLRSDVLGKTILFIGYSLSDINLRYLIYRLQKQWEKTDCKNDRPKSFIFLTRPNIVQECLLTNRGITPIKSELDESGEALCSFLQKLYDSCKQKRPRSTK